jgi:hypothetical protein
MGRATKRADVLACAINGPSIGGRLLSRLFRAPRGRGGRLLKAVDLIGKVIVEHKEPVLLLLSILVEP